jgi:hypothetical protein
MEHLHWEFDLPVQGEKRIPVAPADMNRFIE